MATRRVPQTVNPPKFGSLPEVGVPSPGVLNTPANNRNLVSATLPGRGGYPPNRNTPYTTIQHRYVQNNLLNIIAAITTSASAADAMDLMGPEDPSPHAKRSTPPQQVYRQALSKRLASSLSNALHQMARQEVLVYNAKCKVHDLAREASLLRIGAAGQAADRRQADLNLAELNSYYARTYSNLIRQEINREINKLNAGTRSTYKRSLPDNGMEKIFERRRLRALEAQFSTPPASEGPFVSRHQVPPPMTPYFLMSEDDRYQFWFSRFDDFKLTIYWPFRGIFDIYKTFDQATNPEMYMYGMYSFAEQADAMYYHIIGPQTQNDELKQAKNAHDTRYTLIYDAEAYRRSMHQFTQVYNLRSREDPMCGHFGERYVIEDLSKVKIVPGSRELQSNTRAEDTHLTGLITAWKISNNDR